MTLNQLIRRAAIVAASLVIANDLLWLTALNIPAGPPLCQGVSAALWALGLGSICFPWVLRRSEPIAWLITACAWLSAYVVAIALVSQFESPLFANFGRGYHIVEVILVTWSLAGGLALMLAVWLPPPLARLLPARYRVLESHEVAGVIAPFAPDPAVLIALNGLPEYVE